MTVHELGALLGVSGATARRWELGTSRPGAKDIQRMAEVLYLTPLEAAFLDRVFRSGASEKAPVAEAFSRLAARVLETNNPVIVMDSLLFIRARNPQSKLVLGVEDPSLLPHPFFGLFAYVEAAKTDEQKVQRRFLLNTWLMRFWNSTSRLCGSAGYRALLQRLTEIPGFTEAWSNLASHWPERVDEVLGGPYFSDSGPAGTYRVFETRAFTPATYYFMEWLPIDDTAKQAIAEAVSEAGSSVLTSKYKHWSEDPFLFDEESVPWPRMAAE